MSLSIRHRSPDKRKVKMQMKSQGMPVVSIIVPVYNVGSYLRECIESILRQSFTDFELLLIDDGSTDCSGSICDEYAEKDCRIKVFHKANGGVSSARNWGLENTNGEYVIFVDSDDYLLDGALDILDENASDLTICSFETFVEEGERCVHMQNNRILSDEASLRDFYSLNLNTILLRNPWSKIFRRNLIGALRFDKKIRVGEDTVFVMKYLLNVKSCRVSDKLFYAYRVYNISFFSKYNLGISESIYILSQLLEAYDKLNVYSLDFEKWMLLDYRLMCRKELDKHPRQWYKNPIVKSIYNRIKRRMGWKFRIRYALLSMPLFIRMSNFIKDK